MGLVRAVAAGLMIARYVVFAHLMSSYEFGLAASAMLVMEMLRGITRPNFSAALIQHQGDIEPYYDTALWATVGWAVVISVLMIIGAKPMATFFRQPAHYKIFWTMVPIVLMFSLQSPATALLYRSMRFHIELVLTFAENALAFSVGIGAALIWRDWRAVVAAGMAGQTARTLLTYWYFPYRPRSRFSVARARELLSFGGWVTATNGAWLTAGRLDNVVVGHLLGPGALGLYQMAFRLAEMPLNEIARSARQVFFPVIAQIGMTMRRRRKMFLASNLVVLILGGVYALILVKWGYGIITLAFGAKWRLAYKALFWLAPLGIFQGTLVLARSFLDGLGEPRISFFVALLRATLLCLLIYPLTLHHGIGGAGIAATVSVAVPAVATLWLFQVTNARQGLAPAVKRPISEAER